MNANEHQPHDTTEHKAQVTQGKSTRQVKREDQEKPGPGAVTYGHLRYHFEPHWHCSGQYGLEQYGPGGHRAPSDKKYTVK